MKVTAGRSSLLEMIGTLLGAAPSACPHLYGVPRVRMGLFPVHKILPGNRISPVPINDGGCPRRGRKSPESPPRRYTQ